MHAVRQRLQQAERAYARWSPTVLDAANYFTLQPRGIGHAREHDKDHQRDLNYGSDNKSFCIHGPYTFFRCHDLKLVRVQANLEQKFIQKSTASAFS